MTKVTFSLLAKWCCGNILRQACSLAISLSLGAAAHALPVQIEPGELDPALTPAFEQMITETAATLSEDRPGAAAAQLSDIATRYLRALGYVDARANATLTERQHLHLTLQPGPRYRYGAITVSPARIATDRSEADLALQFEAQTRLTQDAFVEADAVLRTDAELVALLHESGFVQAESQGQQAVIDRAQSRVDIHFSLTPGAFARLGAPVDQSARLHPELLATLQTWTEGAPARRSDLAALVARLEALESVRFARARFGDPDPVTGRVPVEVNTTPASRYRAEGAAGYASSEGLSLSANLIRRDLTGRDERLTVSASLAELESRLSASFQRPHSGRYGRTLTLSGVLERARTDAFNSDSAALALISSRQVSPALNVGLETRISTLNGEDAAGDRRLTTLVAALSTGLDKRDDTLDPTTGVLLNVRGAPAYSFGDDSVTFFRTQAEARAYHSLGAVTLAARGQVGALIGASARQAPADLRFYAGGGGSVRGYAYQSLSPELTDPEVLRDLRQALAGEFEYFGGASLLELNLEARWRIHGPWGMTAFLDGGVASLEQAPDFSQLRYGAGLGLRYHTAFGPIRMDLATPLDRRETDDALQVYISIGQAF